MENLQPNNNIPHPVIEDDEIDLIALVKTLWTGRKIVIISLLFGAMLGIIIAISSPVEYTASTVMVPQVGNSSQSQLGGLAALAGINLNMNQSSDLSPILYPQIVSSIPFQLELMNTKFNFQNYPHAITLFDYYTKNNKQTILGTVKKYTIGLPGLIISAFRGKPKAYSFPIDSVNSAKQPLSLTASQLSVKNALEQFISLEVNAKESYLTLSTRMSEPLVAAQLAQKSQDLLQKYITKLKIEKAKANLDFIQERYNEIKTEFEKAQLSLAMVNDRNKNFTSSLPRIEIDRIQTKYTISLNIYTELAKQLEQAKIQVKVDTPVFIIIEPAVVPLEKSKPKKSMILMIWIFLSGVIGTGIVFGKQYIGTIKEKWNEE